MLFTVWGMFNADGNSNSVASTFRVSDQLSAINVGATNTRLVKLPLELPQLLINLVRLNKVDARGC